MRFSSKARLRWLALGAGVLAGTGQAPLQLWPLAMVGFAIGVVLWQRARDPREALILGWCLGFGAFVSSLTWLVEPFLIEPERHAWMIPFALFAMTGGLATLWMGAFWAAKRFRLGLWGLVALWSAAELLRGYLFTGFPWALPAYIWLDTPIAQLSAFVGPYGLSALTFAFALGLALAYLRRSLGALALSLVFGAALAVIGAMRAGAPLPDDSSHILRVVQPNAAQHLKWNPDYIPTFYARALDLSVHDGADLVIWPETSIAEPLFPGDSAFGAAGYLEEIAATVAPAKAVVGLQRINGRRGYNSAAVVGAGGRVEALYDKRHLVPFGEYMPFPKVMQAIGLRAFTAQAGFGFSAGDAPELFDFGALGTALPLICYEAIFPRDLRANVRPDWLLQITNDAWFGKLNGPQQSLAQARFRSIETGLPLVRAANTGISAVIDARGGVRASVPLGMAGAITHPLPVALPETPYSLLGEWPVIVLLTFFSLWSALGSYRRRTGGVT